MIADDNAAYDDDFAFGNEEYVAAIEPLSGEAPLDDGNLLVADSLVYAGFGVRLAARLIDMILIFVIAFVTDLVGAFLIVITLQLMGAPSQAFAASLSTTTAWAYVIAMVAAVTYHALAEGLHGSTPGKMALGLTVLSDGGNFCGLPSAFGRELAYFLDSLFFGVFAYSNMRRSRKRQRLGDKWAHTVVVRRSSLSDTQRRSPWRFVGACAAACLVYSGLTFATLLLKV